MSAYEKLTGQDPRKILERLFIFGSKAFVHNQKDDISKMHDKAFEGIYIGYDLRSSSHKILNIATGKIIYSINVKTVDKINSKKIKFEKKVLKDVNMEILPIDEATLAPELPLPAPEISPEFRKILQYKQMSILQYKTKIFKLKMWQTIQSKKKM